MIERWAYATNFLLACAVGVVFVFLADLQDRYGLTDWQLGIVASAGFVAALVTQLALSPLIDRGHGRMLAVVGILCGGVGTLSFAVTEQFWSLALSRGSVGIGLGLFNLIARKAILGLDVAGGGKKLGTLLSTGVGGFILGPAIGALLGRLSFAAPFLFIGTFVLLVGLRAARLIAKANIATAEVSYADIRQLLKTRRVRTAVVVQIIIFGFIGIFDAILDRYLTDLGGSTADVALTLVIVGAPMLVLPRLVGGIAERVGGARTLLPGLAMMIPAMYLYGTTGAVLGIAAIGLLHGAGESFAAISAQVLMLEETGTERAAIGSAIMETAGLGTATLSALAAPIVYGARGHGALFGGTAIIGLALSVFVVRQVFWFIRNSAPQPVPV